MWIGRGQANQWPADAFTHNVDQAIADDLEWAEAQELTLDEFRASYLLVFLGVVPPAGNG